MTGLGKLMANQWQAWRRQSGSTRTVPLPTGLGWGSSATPCFAAWTRSQEEAPDWPRLRRLGTAAGCTAVAAVVQRGKVTVANAGDSRCVLCRGGTAVEMSSDHKPDLPEELARIEQVGLSCMLVLSLLKTHRGGGGGGGGLARVG